MHCDHDGCDQLARFTYTWPWGDTGLCCNTHHFTVQQKAEQLSRAVVFSPIAVGTPEPMSRDERTRLRAQVLTLEEEIQEARQRGQEWYAQNTKLAEEARRYAARNAELEAQLKDARADMETAQEAVGQLRRDLADAVAELARIKAIMPPAQPESQPESR